MTVNYLFSQHRPLAGATTAEPSTGLLPAEAAQNQTLPALLALLQEQPSVFGLLGAVLSRQSRLVRRKMRGV